MKENELRIGNYVILDANADIKIIQWSSNHLWAIGEGLEEFDNFEPVPLSEQFCIDFGFESNTIWYRKGNHAINLADGIYEYKNILIKEIHFVHQLQNIYFEIEGIELTKTI